MVFNAARNDEYLYKVAEKYSFGSKIEREEIVGNKDEQKLNEIASNLKSLTMNLKPNVGARSGNEPSVRR